MGCSSSVYCMFLAKIANISPFLYFSISSLLIESKLLEKRSFSLKGWVLLSSSYLNLSSDS